ncbi:MAG TPA: envelope stress response membrane protein PspB [Allosphingosinicella sp.]|jgi:phage shock protein B
MDEVWIPIIIVPILFLALPWLILHYVTKWKVNSSLTAEDETMLDDLYELARRLDDRMHTIERIVHDDNPNWHALAADRGLPRIERGGMSDFAPRSEERSGAPDLSKSGRA